MPIVGQLLVQIAADTAKLTAGLETSQKQMKAWERNVNSAIKNTKNAFAALGVAIGVNELANFVKGSIDAADSLNDMSKSTGISVENLSAWTYEGIQAGVTAEDIGTSVKKLSTLMREWSQGSEKAVQVFTDLHIAVKNADGTFRSADSVLRDVADRFHDMPDGVGKSALAVELFGRSGTKMIPLLDDGAAGLDKMRAKAEQFGDILSTKNAKAADDFNDTLARMKAHFENIAVGMAPALNKLASWVDTLINARAEFKALEKAQNDASNVGKQGSRVSLMFTPEQVDAAVKMGGQITGVSQVVQKALREMTPKEKELAKQEQAWKDYWEAASGEYADKRGANSAKMAEEAGKQRQFWLQIDADASAKSIQQNYDYAHSFGGIHDAIEKMGTNFTTTMTEMVMTGKLSFQKLGQAFIADFLNVIIHEAITMPLFRMLFGGVGAAAGGGILGGALGGAFGGLFADGGDPPIGKASIVGERGPELIVPRGPQTVIPMAKMGGSKSAISIGSIDMRGADPETVVRLEKMLKSVNASVENRSIGAVLDDIRRGGPMARAIGGA